MSRRLNGNLGALAGLARNGADDDGVVVDLRDFRLEEIRNQLRRGAGDDDLRSLGGAIHLEQHHAHALADGELLQPRLFALGAAGFGLAQVVDHVLAFDALHGGVQHFLLAMGVLLEDRVALGFTHLLEDDLLGQLRGDAAQRAGVAIEANLAAHLDARGQFIGLGQRDLVDRIFDLLFVGHDRLVDIGRDLAGLLVQLAAHVFLGLVVLARGQGNRLFHGADNDLGLNALLAAQELDTLIQHAGGHTLLALSVCSCVGRCLQSAAVQLFRCPWGTGSGLLPSGSRPFPPLRTTVDEDLGSLKSPEPTALSRCCRSAISTVFTPAFRLLLFCFTAERSSVIVLAASRPPAGPASGGCCGSARRSAPSPGNRQTAETLPAVVSLRSRPGELASSVYSAPGTRSSTSSSTPKSRLNAAQILMCDAGKLIRIGPGSNFPRPVAPEVHLLPLPSAALSRARPSAFFSRKTRRVRSLAGPTNSMSTTSSPCEAATRSAANRI